MPDNIYEYPLSAPVFDNGSIAREFIIPPVKPAITQSTVINSPIIQYQGLTNSTRLLHNCNKCGSDMSYYQPVCSTLGSIPPSPPITNAIPECVDTVLPACYEQDIIIYQFQFTDKYNNWPASSHGWSPTQTGNWLIHVQLLTPDGCDVTSYILDSFVGITKEGKHIQQISFDTSDMPSQFQFVFTMRDPDGNIVVYSEPYEKIDCACQDSIVMEGVYPINGPYVYDCAGFFYGNLIEYYMGTFFTYTNRVRVIGELEYNGFTITQTNESKFSKNIATTSETKEIYRLRLMPVPEYMARRIQRIFEAKTILINGIEFEGNVSFEKNNEMGSMWHIDVKVSSMPCIKRYFTCETRE